MTLIRSSLFFQSKGIKLVFQVENFCISDLMDVKILLNEYIRQKFFFLIVPLIYIRVKKHAR